jgi:hypothetical protein
MTRLACLAVLSLLAAAALPARQPQSGIPEAMRLMPSDPAAAAKVLEEVTKREPKNQRAWRLLGTARQGGGQLDAAIEAFQQAIAIGPDPAATYSIGIVHAQKKDADKAFEWLAKAKATGQVDMTQMQVDPHLAAYRDEPRFKTLLPTRKDFADPFVEPATIVHEWHGEAINDQFGWIARAIGDVDRDGIADLVVSAPYTGDQKQPAGSLYVYSAKSGALLWKKDGAAGDRLGITVEAAGDVNADGIPDVVATGGGKVHVFGGRDGAALRTFSSPGPLPLRAAATAGDVNRDGHADILAGATPAPQAGKPPAPARGAAYVFSGKDGAVLLSLEGEREGDNFGSAVAGHAGDKHTLLIVGAPAAGERKTGRVYVYTKLADTPAFVIDSDDTGAALGAMFVAVPGDVNNDGTPDVFASDFSNRAQGTVHRPRLRPLRQGRLAPADADGRGAWRGLRHQRLERRRPRRRRSRGFRHRRLAVRRRGALRRPHLRPFGQGRAPAPGHHVPHPGRHAGLRFRWDRGRERGR